MLIGAPFYYAYPSDGIVSFDAIRFKQLPILRKVVCFHKGAASENDI